MQPAQPYGVAVRYLLLTALLLMASSAGLAQSMTGKVLLVHDGDTLTVLDGQTRLKVRLTGIDAPELRQAFGPQSKESLEDLCLARDATVKVVARDHRGGGSGLVKCDGVDASAEQVKRGMAWVYKPHVAATSPLYFLEDQAQRSREGLWKEPSPLAPWLWRSSRHRR